MAMSASSALSPPSSVTSQKRSHMAGDSSTEGSRKRRSPEACRACRARKVRCDVFESGPSCTNCRLDNVECVSPTPQKRRSTGRLAASKARRNTLPKSHRADPFSLERDKHQHCARQDIDVVNPDENKIFTAEPNDEFFTQDGSSAAPIQSTNMTANATTGKIQRDAISEIARSLPCPAVGPPPLPPFIRPLRSNIDPIDLEYLQNRGVFWLPERDALEELLHTYFNMIHPFTPILDREVISKVVKSQITVHEGEDARISLLLMQALLFVSSSFVKSSFLEEWGYGNRAEFRSGFYKRAKTLYELDLEPDPVAHLQALLLLTYWFDPDASKNGWFWLEAAVSQAQLMDLSGLIQRSSNPRHRSLLKRLWWCCYIKENATHLELRQIPRLRLEIFPVEPLSLEDFGIVGDEHYAKQSLSKDDFLSTSPIQERTIAILCIEMAKLCVCLNRILSIRLTATTLARSDLPSTCGPMTMSKRRAIILETKACDALLRHWKQTLHPEAQWQEYNSQDNLDISIKVHRIMVNMMYFAAMSTLYQVQGFPLTAKAPADIEGHQFHELSQRKVCDAAQEITKLAEAAGRHGLAPYLPDYGLVLLLPAIVVHLLRFRSRDREARKEASQNLSICIEFVEGLKETCSAAHRVVHLLAPALDKSGCSLHSTAFKRRADSSSAQTIHEELNPPNSTSPELLISSSFKLTGINVGNERLTDCDAITPPASPDNPKLHDMAKTRMHENNWETITPITVDELNPPPLSIYDLTDAGMSEIFAGFNTMGSADPSYDQFFDELNSPVIGFMESYQLDMKWIEDFVQISAVV